MLTAKDVRWLAATARRLRDVSGRTPHRVGQWLFCPAYLLGTADRLEGMAKHARMLTRTHRKAVRP